MHIRADIPLAPYTTFQIGGPARLFCSVSSEGEVVEAITFAKENDLRFFILGKGSNLLISDDGFPGLVIKNEIRGMRFGPSDGIATYITAGAGENWDDFVDETVRRGFSGLENLSAIPGSVGAAPVQNLGAYGVDAGDHVSSVRALDTESMQFVDIPRDHCGFTYRDSIFKREKGRYVIISVTFRLERGGTVNTSYRDLAEYFAKPDAPEPTPATVRDAVIAIRLKKLPDWKEWGTAGSYFKNPVISAGSYAKLKEKYPELPGFPEADGRVKVPLGWIIDHICEMKGIIHGHAQTYERQALVIVTRPGASSAEVMELAREVMKCVKEKTGIEIEGEVEWVC